MVRSTLVTVGRRPTTALVRLARAGLRAEGVGLVDPPVDPGTGYDPFPRYDSTPFVRPVGTDYLAWEDIVGASEAARQAANPNQPTLIMAADLQAIPSTSPKIITFPAGMFHAQAGMQNYGSGAYKTCAIGMGAGFAPGVRGIVGSGSQSTPGQAGAQTTIKPYGGKQAAAGNVITANGVVAAEFGGFNLITDHLRGDGMYFSGLVISGSDPKVHHLFLRGASPGYANYPPGETFGININKAVRATISECEVDGRDIAGTRTCASPIGWNGVDPNTSGVFPYVTDARLIRCFVHHGLTGMLTFWQTRNIYTEDFYSFSTGSGDGVFRGSGINHEQSGGTIRHVRPRLYVASPKSLWPDKTTNNGFNFGFGTVIDDAGANMLIEDPRWDWQDNMATPMLAMSGRWGYKVTTAGLSDRNGGQYMLTPPTVVIDGIELACSRQYNVPGGTFQSGWNNKNPKTHYAWST